MAKAYSYIRFSTLEQAKGDSLRRQLEATMRLAARRKLQLDDSLKDVGVSGFKGRNKRSGALSRFLAQIEAGKVERGSWLIVESLDRISREDPWDAFATLTQIVNAGVTVATTIPEMVISREESAKNPGLLFLIIGIALRAHEESKMKSYRITKSWEEKRSSKKAGTNQCPAWLRRDGENWVQIPERVAVLKDIFALSLAGHGDGTIAKKLNERGEQPWGRGGRKAIAWHESYVTKILSGKAVLGEHQFFRKGPDGKRVPIGEPIPDYYPQVIDDTTYYAVVAKRKARKGVGVGPTSTKVSNLFSGVLKCSGCTKTSCTKPPSIVFVDKGDECRYLVCQGARLGTGCDYVSWPYEEFERLFLELITQIDLSSIFEQEDAEADVAKLELTRLDGQLEEVRKQAARIEEAIVHTTVPIPSLMERLSALEMERTNLEEMRRGARATLTRLERSRMERKANTEALRSLVANASEVEKRHQLREQIRERITAITVKMKDRPSPLPSISPKDRGALQLYYARYVETLTVVFRTGAQRIMQLWPIEPTKYMRGKAGQERAQRWGGFRLIDVTESGMMGSPERIAEIEKHGLEKMSSDES